MAARKKAKILTKAQRLVREKAIIKELRAGGLSYRRIAEKFGVSLPTVNAKARKAGISRRPGVRPSLKAGAKARAAAPAMAAPMKARRTRRAVGRPRKAGRMARRTSGFQEQFRALVMSYYPDISLRKFDQLARQIEQVVA